MPEIQYPKNPNSDTAFVVQEDGTKNRALMTAPQDTSSLELPTNSNSCKGYVTVDGKKQRVILTADIGGGGGGSVDTSKVINADVLPTADASSAGKYYLYTGATTAEYTQNYIYKNVKTATYTGEIFFAWLDTMAIDCSAANFANFISSEIGVDPTLVTQGAMIYRDTSSWELLARNSDGELLGSVTKPQQDYESSGFTFTGAGVLTDGDTESFDCTITEDTVSYAWTQIDVQPAGSSLPDQTGHAGEFLTTDGTDASWSDKPLVNRATGPQSDLIIAPSAVVDSNDHGIIIYSGSGSVISGYNSIAIGSARTGDNAICMNAFSATGTRAIQIGGGVSASNPDANTFKVGNANGNYEMMNANGNLPADRLASTTGLTDGNYRLRLTITNGEPTLSWVAE